MIFWMTMKTHTPRLSTTEAMDNAAAAALLARHRVVNDLEVKGKELCTIVGFLRKYVSTAMAGLQQELATAVQEAMSNGNNGVAGEMLKWRLTQLVELKTKGVMSMLEALEGKIAELQLGHRRLQNVLLYRPAAPASSAATSPQVDGIGALALAARGEARRPRDNGEGGTDGAEAKRAKTADPMPPPPNSFLPARKQSTAPRPGQQGPRYKRGMFPELDGFLASFKAYLETEHRSAHTKERLGDVTILSRVSIVRTYLFLHGSIDLHGLNASQSQARRIALKNNITTYTLENVSVLSNRCVLDENAYTALKDIGRFLVWKQSKSSAAATGATTAVETAAEVSTSTQASDTVEPAATGERGCIVM